MTEHKIIRAPRKMQAVMMLVVCIFTFVIPITGASVGVLPALFVRNLFGNNEAAFVVWIAVVLCTLPIPYLLFRNWRFQMELTSLELIAGRFFPKRFFYREIRLISVCPAPRQSRWTAQPAAEKDPNSQAFINVKSDTDAGRIYLPPCEQDSFALELLDVCPNAILIDAQQREHLPRRLAEAAQRGIDGLRRHEVEEILALMEKALAHHRLFARIFTVSMLACWVAIPIIAALLFFDPNQKPGEGAAYLRVLPVLFAATGLFTFAARRSRLRYRQAKNGVTALRDNRSLS